MYGSNRQYAEQYRKVGVSTSVTEADPHKLVSLLFAGACQLFVWPRPAWRRATRRARARPSAKHAPLSVT